MNNQEIITQLQTIAANLYHVRLPVEEASAYSTVLTSANQISKIAKEMKEDAAHDADNQPE